MSTPDDNARQPRDMSFASDEVTDTAFVESAIVVDDQDVARVCRRDPLEKHIRAARMPCRTRSTGDPHTSTNRAQMRRSQSNRKLEKRASIGDEWRRPFEVAQQCLVHFVPLNWQGLIRKDSRTGCEK